MTDLGRIESLQELEDVLSAWEGVEACCKDETLPWEEVRERLLAAAES